jgi:hypothetical protein
MLASGVCPSLVCRGSWPDLAEDLRQGVELAL